MITGENYNGIVSMLVLIIAAFVLGMAFREITWAGRATPEPTPYIWLAPSPYNAACVIWRDNPCNLFQWPAPKETPK